MQLILYETPLSNKCPPPRLIDAPYLNNSNILGIRIEG